MAGFNSPLFFLGISATKKAGFRTPLPFWLGGAGTEEVTPPVEPEIPARGNGGLGNYRGGYLDGYDAEKKEALAAFEAQLLIEDEEILAIIMAAVRVLH